MTHCVGCDRVVCYIDNCMQHAHAVLLGSAVFCEECAKEREAASRAKAVEVLQAQVAEHERQDFLLRETLDQFEVVPNLSFANRVARLLGKLRTVEGELRTLRALQGPDPLEVALADRVAHGDGDEVVLYDENGAAVTAAQLHTALLAGEPFALRCRDQVRLAVTRMAISAVPVRAGDVASAERFLRGRRG